MTGGLDPLRYQRYLNIGNSTFVHRRDGLCFLVAVPEHARSGFPMLRKAKQLLKYYHTGGYVPDENDRRRHYRPAGRKRFGRSIFAVDEPLPHGGIHVRLLLLLLR